MRSFTKYNHFFTINQIFICIIAKLTLQAIQVCKVCISNSQDVMDSFELTKLHSTFNISINFIQPLLVSRISQSREFSLWNVGGN